jgi:hypothetical protein
MPSVDRLQIQEHQRHSVKDLLELRRHILRYARSSPPGSERNQHRQVALSLARLFKNRNRLAANTSDG